jgi:hypothetical protein
MSSSPESAPLVCNMEALNPKEREAHEALTVDLFTSAEDVSPLPNGLAIRFPNERANIVRLAEFIAKEQACCPFLTFDLRVKPQKAQVELELSGERNVKQFLLDEFAELLKGRSL